MKRFLLAMQERGKIKPREREALEHYLSELDTSEIASRMGITTSRVHGMLFSRFTGVIPRLRRIVSASKRSGEKPEKS